MDMATALAELGAIGTSIDAETRDRRYQEPQRPARRALHSYFARRSRGQQHPGRLGAQ